MCISQGEEPHVHVFLPRTSSIIEAGFCPECALVDLYIYMYSILILIKLYCGNFVFVPRLFQEKP